MERGLLLNDKVWAVLSWDSGLAKCLIFSVFWRFLLEEGLGVDAKGALWEFFGPFLEPREALGFKNFGGDGSNVLGCVGMAVGGKLSDEVGCGLDVVVGESFDEAIAELILNGAGLVVVDKFGGGDGVGESPAGEGIRNEALAVNSSREERSWSKARRRAMGLDSLVAVWTRVWICSLESRAYFREFA